MLENKDMEQFDTDEKLVENSKEKKPKNSCLHYFIIAVFCICALCLIFFLFKSLKKKNKKQNMSIADESKQYF